MQSQFQKIEFVRGDSSLVKCKWDKSNFICLVKVESVEFMALENNLFGKPSLKSSFKN